MWPSDPIFTELVSELFPRASPFQCLPEQVEREDADSVETLSVGLQRLFGCQAARDARFVVFVWALDQPYMHRDGTHEPSTIVNVEKTQNSIYDRWGSGIYQWLLRDAANNELKSDDEDLRHLANHKNNFRFYSTIIRSLGPLRVWWADVDHLNAGSGRDFTDPRCWERLILERYRQRYGCLPLKNRKV